MPFFWQKDKPFSLNPREVLENQDKFDYRMKRIMEVDTNYPIDIMFWKGQWVIVDGLYRYCQLVAKGEKIIKVRKVPVEWKERIMPD